MADGIFASVVSRTRDANSASNVLFTQLADNAGNAVTVTGNKLDVNATVTLETAYTDDSAFSIGSDKVNAQGYLADETAPDSVDEGDIGLARMTLDRKVLQVIVDPTTDSQRWAIDASGHGQVDIAASSATVTIDANSSDVTVDNAGGGAAVNIQDGGNSITVDGSVTVSATDLDIRDIVHTQDSVAIGDGTSVLVDVLDSTIDALYVAITDGTDSLAINSNGSINVVPAWSPITGEVHDYDTASAVAADATDNHDYTVSTAMLLSSVIVSGSGNVKFEVQVGPIASLATIAVGFLTGRQGDTKQIFFDPPVEVPTTGTGTVRIIRTNRQGASTDLYSTIIGVDA